jgi:hypothetical protein
MKNQLILKDNMEQKSRFDKLTETQKAKIQAYKEVQEEKEKTLKSSKSKDK